MDLVWKPELQAFDLDLTEDGDIKASDELATAIILSLFTDAREHKLNDDLLDPTDWHGNKFDVPGDKRMELGSLLHRLKRQRMSPEIILMVRQRAHDALMPLILENMANGFLVDVELGTDTVYILIRSLGPDERQFKFVLFPLG